MTDDNNVSLRRIVALVVPRLVLLIILLVVLIAVFETNGSGGRDDAARPAVATGDTAKFPENMLVVVKNPDGVSRGVHEYAFSDQCLALAGSPMTAVAVHDGRVLVRHGKPTGWFYGVCIPGVLTFVTIEEFVSFDARYAGNVERARRERELVRELLSEQADPSSDRRDE